LILLVFYADAPFGFFFEIYNSGGYLLESQLHFQLNNFTRIHSRPFTRNRNWI